MRVFNFFNLDAMWHQKIFFIINLCHVDISYYFLTLPFATFAISVSDVTAGTKMEAFFRRGTKSGKKKT